MDTPQPSPALLAGKKAAYCTLGCKLNFAETASLSDKLSALGMEPVRRSERADVCVVNTCSVTDVADHKCRQAIRRLVRQHPGAFVVVMGCYAQLKPQEIAAMQGVSLVLSQAQKADVVSYIIKGVSAALPASSSETFRTETGAPFVPSCSRGNRTRYFLKVQDGCNYFCTYCTIPFARGRSRNGSIASLVEQAQGVAARGGKEIVITGVNIGDFGRTTGETFFDLVRALDAVEGIERYRISSIEPNLLTDDIINFCAQSRAFMPHFHIPLQSGSDAVLRLMHRRYDTALFRHKVEAVKAVMPDAFIGVDVIVGTRGETAELFEESYEFLSSLPVSQLHVFSYSERPGTKALEIPHVVSLDERHARSQRLLELSEQKRRAFYAQFVGTTRPVLWERSKAGQPLHGFTDNYIRVSLSDGQAADNSITPARLGEFTPDAEALQGFCL